MTIKLPNDHQIITKYAGTINFSTDLTIKNVLYVPNFHINLISITNLCSDSNCLVSFTDQKCLIQEQKALRMIGSAEMMDGLYYLVLPNKEAVSDSRLSTQTINSINYVSLPDNALWHFRLGHLSNSRMLNLQSQFPFVISDHKAVCDICHFAKHGKSTFTHSSNKALKPYDLIHFDILIF